MGILWRLLAPKGLKRVRRSVRKVAHPVRTASWALSPKPVKQARRAAFKVAHPGHAIEWAVSDQIVRSVRGGKRRRKPPARSGASRAAPPREEVRSVQTLWLPGSAQIPVAGESYHLEAIREWEASVRSGQPPEAVLIPEPTNPHDPNAVAVHTAGGVVGYLPRHIATVLQPVLAGFSASHDGLPVACPARIDPGPQIVLMIDLAELGVDPAAFGHSR